MPKAQNVDLIEVFSIPVKHKVGAKGQRANTGTELVARATHERGDSQQRASQPHSPHEVLRGPGIIFRNIVADRRKITPRSQAEVKPCHWSRLVIIAS